eukprot:2522913-Rhodomonas_salina.1
MLERGVEGVPGERRGVRMCLQGVVRGQRYGQRCGQPSTHVVTGQKPKTVWSLATARSTDWERARGRRSEQLLKAAQEQFK